MVPPSELRAEKKSIICDARRRFVKFRLKVAEQREKFRIIVPLLCRYNEFSIQIKPWLDEAEIKSEKFIDKYDDDITLLENANEIEVSVLCFFT